MTLREAVFNALADDATLGSLGITRASLYPNWTPDSPAADQMRWVVLRWGVADTPPGRDTTARNIAMTVWAYDREPTYSRIDPILRRCRAVLDGLIAARYTGGAVLDVRVAFSSEDTWDGAYDAVSRSDTYQIVASGF